MDEAHGIGCPKGDICDSVAEGGHLHVLKWARENGCCWDENTYSSALLAGHEEVLKWALDNGAPLHYYNDPQWNEND